MPKAATGQFAIMAYLLFLGVVALTGGSSQYESARQPLVRLAGIILIGALILHSPRRSSLCHGTALWFIGALASLILIQLVPLPPAWWGALPGHQRYLAAAVVAGESQPWRPLNLTPDRGWNALFALLPPAATMFAAGRLRLRDQGAVLLGLIVIVLTSAVIGLVQISAGPDDALRFYAAPRIGSAVGLFANRNHQALLIACGLPMLALWALRARGDRMQVRLRAVLALIGGVFLVLMVPATGSRMGLVLAGLALTAAVILSWPLISSGLAGMPRSHRRIAAGASFLAFVALIATALTFPRAEAVQRLFAIDPIADARIQLLEPLIGMIRTFLPFGSGFGSFDPVYRGFEPFGSLAVTFLNQAHNDFLQLMLEGGVPALALLLVFLGWWARTSVRLWRKSGSETAALGQLGSILLLLILLASLTDYPVRTPFMMVIAAQAGAWMLLSIGSARNIRDQGPTPLPPPDLHL